MKVSSWDISEHFLLSALLCYLNYFKQIRAVCLKKKIKSHKEPEVTQAATGSHNAAQFLPECTPKFTV